MIRRGTDPSVARDGTLLYRGEPYALARLAWFTMDGGIGDTLAPKQEWIEAWRCHAPRELVARLSRYRGRQEPSR